MSGAPAVVALQDVVVDYRTPGGSMRALDNVTLAIPAGQGVAVVGRSGSGKSTLVSVLGLLRSPTSGQVRLAGVPVHSDEGARRRARAGTVGMVFQSFHLETHLTATENTMLGWYTAGLGGARRSARARATGLLDVVGLGALANRLVAEMSGGERQRVAIARALFAQPQLLIADEPTGNLDEQTAGVIADILWSLPGPTGAAVVVVTHDLQVAAGADRTVRLANGHIEGQDL
jgi:predicted ABC-type transport system involved in lysophospholipase L1 biosynthesis ATPase subunit